MVRAKAMTWLASYRFLDVHMERSPSGQTGKLVITVHLRPGKLGLRGDPHEWRTWCEKKLMDLSSYLIAKKMED